MEQSDLGSHLLATEASEIQQKTAKQMILVVNSNWVIFHAFLSSADFFQNQFFQKILSGIPSECQMIWIQIGLDFMSSLIWVQTVCKDYQQTKNVVAAGKELTERNTQFYVTKTVAKHIPTAYKLVLWNIKYI